MIRRWQGAMNH